MDNKYSENRPAIPAETERMIKVDAGYQCSIKNCNEHTYLEIHHIDFNRENNSFENLILLCDKHHKMAHKKIIDRKALLEFKKNLNTNIENHILERINNLELKLGNESKIDINEDKIKEVENPEYSTVKISGQRRGKIFYYILDQLCISKLEEEEKKIYLRTVKIKWKNKEVNLDAIFCDNDSGIDTIVEICWIRKLYLDIPIHIKRLEEKLSIYEITSKRRVSGTIIFAVSKDYMKDFTQLPQSYKAFNESSRKLKYLIFSYNDLGFSPSGIGVADFTKL